MFMATLFDAMFANASRTTALLAVAVDTALFVATETPEFVVRLPSTQFAPTVPNDVIGISELYEYVSQLLPFQMMSETL